MTIFRWSPIQDRDKRVPYYGNYYNEEECDCGCDTFDSWNPSTDIYNTKDSMVFLVELPGVSKEDVNIEIKDSILVISGNRKRDHEYEDAKIYVNERCNGKFYRAFRLPKEIDAGKVEASIKDGILELRLGKHEEQKPKQIKIDVQ